jgi:hypothetical protein
LVNLAAGWTGFGFLRKRFDKVVAHGFSGRCQFMVRELQNTDADE